MSWVDRAGSLFVELQVPDYSAAEGATGGVLTNKAVSMLEDAGGGEGPSGGVQASILSNVSKGGSSLIGASPRAGSHERKPGDSLVERAPME